MADTKKLSVTNRKKAKRNQRKELKELYSSMTLKERKKFRKLEDEPKPGFKKFLTAERKSS